MKLSALRPAARAGILSWLIGSWLNLIFLSAVAAGESRKPNIVFILADDLGYGEVGAFGQKKIRTPAVDRMAAEGLKLTRHYAGSPVCAPSRGVLLTGLHTGHAEVRNNREIKPEGQYPLPPDSVTLAKLLQAEGYVTGAFGKWGLGGPDSSGAPLRQGFDRFYGYNCQRVAHNYYPTHLWDDDRRVALNNAPFASRQKLPVGADPASPAVYERYGGNEYAPDLYGNEALRFIRANKDRPFFLFFPTTVPHLALQAPADSVAEYTGRWEDPPYPGGNGYLPSFEPRATYAGMITRMDRDIGRMMALVEELGLDEETIVVFTSDNGPLWQGFGGTDSAFFESAGPFRGAKGSLYEAGIRVPTVVRWKGRIAAGTESNLMTGFEDWMPTLLELVDAKGAIPEGIDGHSFAPELLANQQSERPFLYREFPAYGGQQSIHLGEWKGVRQNLLVPGEEANLHIELYHLGRDPAEMTDVSAQYPEIVERMERLMREERIPSELFPFPALDEL